MGIARTARASGRRGGGSQCIGSFTTPADNPAALSVLCVCENDVSTAGLFAGEPAGLTLGCLPAMKAKLSLKARQHLLTEANADAKQMQVVVDDQLAALSQLEREQQQLIRAKKKAEAAQTKDAGKPKTAPKSGDEKQGESKWTAKQQTELEEVRGTTVIGRGCGVCVRVCFIRVLCACFLLLCLR